LYLHLWRTHRLIKVVILSRRSTRCVRERDPLNSRHWHTPSLRPPSGLGWASPQRIHQTRSGGLHFVFQHIPGVRNSQGRLAKGVDTRGEGGYAIWWPAARCPVMSDVPPALWPQWLFDALFAAVRRAAQPASGMMGSDTQMIERLARRVIHTPRGRRNGMLFWAACRVGEAIRNGNIDERCGVAVLSGAALRAGLPASEARGRSPAASEPAHDRTGGSDVGERPRREGC
jgi:hypothetical protein